MSIIEDILKASDRMSEILTWHQAAPLVDHDGGDEDDELVKTRQLLRAIRKPGARFFKYKDRLIVVHEPAMILPLIPWPCRDGGDE